MFSKNIFSIMTIFCLIGLVLVCLSGCSEKIVNENANSNITISMRANTSGFEMSKLAQYFWLTVEAEDLPIPIVVPLTMENSFLVGQVIVPVGINRYFTVSAYDALIFGNLIYQGVDSADVTFDSRDTIQIDMFPVVPMMKVIPKINSRRVSSIAMGNSFVADVYIYNIPEVRYISFDLSYLTNNYLLNFLYVSLGTGLPVDSRLSYEGGNASVTIWLDRPNLVESLADTLGNAHLLTFYFDSHSDTMDDIDTASFEITPISLDRGSGDLFDPFPLDSLYLEQAIVELYKVSDS